MSNALVNNEKGTGAGKEAGARSPRGVGDPRGGLQHPPKIKFENLEYAWRDGPLRKRQARPYSAPKYVCGRCLKVVPGLYRHAGLKSAGIAHSDWVGAECRP